MGAKVGGDSPLTERPWKLSIRVVATHNGRQEGELRHCPTNVPSPGGYYSEPKGLRDVTFQCHLLRVTVVTPSPLALAPMSSSPMLNGPLARLRLFRL